MTRRPLGWLVAGASSAALLSGAAALALVSEPRPAPEPMALDLSMIPASAPNLAAMADPAPQVVDEVADQADQPTPPEAEPPPDLQADSAPEIPQQTAALSLPQVDTPALADLSLPPPPEDPAPMEPIEKVARPKPRPEKAPEPEPKRVAEPKPEKKPVEKAEEPVKKAEKPKESEKPKEKATEKKTAAAGATGAKESAKTKGGAEMSPAAFHKAVIKKINRVKKKRTSERGTALVVFSVAADGSLAALNIGQSSGSAELDSIALDHVRRAAPFAAPPPGAGKNLSFKFSGR